MSPSPITSHDESSKDYKTSLQELLENPNLAYQELSSFLLSSAFDKLDSMGQHDWKTFAWEYTKARHGFECDPKKIAALGDRLNRNQKRIKSNYSKAAMERLKDETGFISPKKYREFHLKHGIVLEHERVKENCQMVAKC